jgi:predicted RNA binding protein YcfA (HicA-like mRNA interferase family)
VARGRRINRGEAVSKVKRRDIIILLEQNGWSILRDAGPHTVYYKGRGRISVPRHRELKETLANGIIKKMGELKWEN